MEKLAVLDTLYVHQKTTGCSGNRYEVHSPSGDILFNAEEDACCLAFQGKTRSFYIDIFDEHDREVIRLRRPYTFGPSKMDVTVHGTLVSVVRVEPTFMKPVLNINDANDERVLRIKGPINVHSSANFKIFTKDKTCIGSIRKEWGGFFEEMFTDVDNFVITFPGDLDVRFKAAIIGTCILIDFRYYTD